jgi:HEAT repeat protein
VNAPRSHDPRTVEELLEAALRMPDADLDDDAAYEADQERWRAIAALQGLATSEVLDAAVRLSTGGSAWERRTGIDILAKLGAPDQPFLDERLGAILRALQLESDPGCLASAAFALGHFARPEAVEPLLCLVGHADRLVRHGVVHGLGGLDDARAVDALLSMTCDSDDLVREWAVFHLRHVEPNTGKIRAALRARLDDPDVSTRIEAIAGLAERRDPSALLPLGRELAAIAELPGFEMWACDVLVEAARDCPHRTFLVPLRRLHERFGDFGWLQEAIYACTNEPSTSASKSPNDL